mmetsp:Transcript_5389/g.11440  ORF Transcript_5389/g.11440 Transcript_5389/m.11440 type:complete len:91 (-) Transcript_5389:23-295(-)
MVQPPNPKMDYGHAPTTPQNTKDSVGSILTNKLAVLPILSSIDSTNLCELNGSLSILEQQFEWRAKVHCGWAPFSPKEEMCCWHVLALLP